MNAALLGYVCFLAIAVTTHGRPQRALSSKSSRGTLNIIGGKNASITDFPYMASMMTDNEYFAGAGVILNKHWILTTGLNMDGEKPATVRWRVGSNRWDKGGQTLAIGQVSTHPDFQETYDYDIALVRTKTPIKFNKNVKSIKLGKTPLKAGQQGTISGWGDNESFQASSTLQQTLVTVFDQAKCAAQFDKGQVTARMFCTFDNDTEPYAEDFGDPLVVDGELYGLFSGNMFYSPTPTYASLYSNLPKMRNWIERVIKT